MKKTLNILLGLAIVAIAAVSCKNNENKTFENKAAVDAQGLYEGVWNVTCEDPDVNDTIYYGTIEILPDTVNQSKYVGRIKITRDDNPNEWPKSAMTNIAHAGKDFSFFNSISRDTVVVEGTNKMGSTFAGRLYEDGSATMTCAFIGYVKYKAGRFWKERPVIQVYEFVGTKKKEK